MVLSKGPQETGRTTSNESAGRARVSVWIVVDANESFFERAKDEERKREKCDRVLT